MWLSVFSFMSLPGDDALCWIPSCPLPSVCFPPTVYPVWFGSVCLMTTAGFVAGVILFCSSFCCCFYSVFFLRYRGVRFGSCSCFIFGQLTPNSRCFSLCLYTIIPHSLISFDCCPPFPFSVFFFRCVSFSLSLLLSPCLGCIPLLT